jgi:hypothetical protein
MENTYGVVVDRIRRGLPLSQHQRETLKRCGLAEEDFRNQKSDAEKAAILNAHTKFDCMDCLPKPARLRAEAALKAAEQLLEIAASLPATEGEEK